MPSATRTTVPRDERAPSAAPSAQVVEHPLRLGLRRAAGGGQHLAQQVAGAVLVADLRWNSSASSSLRESGSPPSSSSTSATRRRRCRRAGGVDRLVEVERDAGEVEGERLVARVDGRTRPASFGGQRHLQRRRLLEAGRRPVAADRLGGVERRRLRRRRRRPGCRGRGRCRRRRCRGCAESAPTELPNCDGTGMIDCGSVLAPSGSTDLGRRRVGRSGRAAGAGTAGCRDRSARRAPAPWPSPRLRRASARRAASRAARSP